MGPLGLEPRVQASRKPALCQSVRRPPPPSAITASLGPNPTVPLLSSRFPFSEKVRTFTVAPMIYRAIWRWPKAVHRARAASPHCSPTVRVDPRSLRRQGSITNSSTEWTSPPGASYRVPYGAQVLDHRWRLAHLTSPKHPVSYSIWLSSREKTAVPRRIH